VPTPLARGASFFRAAEKPAFDEADLYGGAISSQIGIMPARSSLALVRRTYLELKRAVAGVLVEGQRRAETVRVQTYLDTEQVDVEASYRVTRNLRLQANVEDVFGKARSSEQGFQRGWYPEDVYRYGWKATFGVDYTF
jgi:hypothetical protein